jgi:hypothetical protein
MAMDDKRQRNLRESGEELSTAAVELASIGTLTVVVTKNDPHI